VKTDGDHYEEASAQWLVRKGLRIVERNYRCRTGEIDLIATDGNTLVFVEVRARTNRQFASAAASIDRRKQRRLARVAAHYLQRHPGSPPSCRFDAVVWEPDADSGKLRARWIRNAFALD